ncbi:hypothetical protein K3H50_04450 [Aeromonas veronii]|uniref:hypothetical protein n=1 Tax=Aeromonas veronii TaxID=654 RepID=UPI001F37722B|nr:hypothetical protein [Aeromonas veronii]MCF5862610.1 hypothetical protein [Aeromonas veronii]
MSVSGCRDDTFNGEFGSRGEEITILACAAIFSIVGAMKLHLYFSSSYLEQTPLGKRCNALRLLHPTSFVNPLGWGGWALSLAKATKGAICAPNSL